MTVSVVIACYNEEKYIEQAVVSVLAQTAQDAIADISVVDDGSTDRTGEILDALASDNAKLKVFHIAKAGLPEARNHGIELAEGTLIALLDGDDYWVPDKLERQLPALQADDPVGLVYSDFIDFTADDASDARLVTVRRFHPDDAKTFATYFVEDGPVMPSTAIIRKAVFDDVGKFDPEYRLGEDTDMVLRVASRWRLAHVPGGLVYKRRHGKNITSRLERLLPVSELQTRRYTERFPELAPLARKRLARRYARAGNDCVINGERAKGTRYLIKAWRHDPTYLRSYAYLILLLWPGKGDRTAAKRLFHWFAWQRRRILG